MFQFWRLLDVLEEFEAGEISRGCILQLQHLKIPPQAQWDYETEPLLACFSNESNSNNSWPVQ